MFFFPSPFPSSLPSIFNKNSCLESPVLVVPAVRPSQDLGRPPSLCADRASAALRSLVGPPDRVRRLCRGHLRRHAADHRHGARAQGPPPCTGFVGGHAPAGVTRCEREHEGAQWCQWSTKVRKKRHESMVGVKQMRPTATKAAARRSTPKDVWL